MFCKFLNWTINWLSALAVIFVTFETLKVYHSLIVESNANQMPGRQKFFFLNFNFHWTLILASALGGRVLLIAKDLRPNEFHMNFLWAIHSKKNFFKLFSLSNTIIAKLYVVDWSSMGTFTKWNFSIFTIVQFSFRFYYYISCDVNIFGLWNEWIVVIRTFENKYWKMNWKTWDIKFKKKKQFEWKNELILIIRHERKWAFR